MSSGDYSSYLAQTGMEKANKPTNLALDNFKDFGKLLSEQAATTNNLNSELAQRDAHFQQQMEIDKAKFGEEQYQFDQAQALEAEKAARDEKRAIIQDQNLKLQMEMNQMKMERDKIDFSKEDEINKFLSDPERNKKFMDAVAKGDVKTLMDDPQTGAMITSMYVSKNENLNNLANQIIAKNIDNNTRLPIQLMTPKMKNTLGSVDGQNINQKLVEFSQDVSAELASGRISKAEALELLKCFTPIATNVKTQIAADKANTQQQNADSMRMNAQANAERAEKGGNQGGFITPDGEYIAQEKVADYISKNPNIDYTQLRSAKSLKTVDKKEKDNDPYKVKAKMAAKMKNGGGSK